MKLVWLGLLALVSLNGATYGSDDGIPSGPMTLDAHGVPLQIPVIVVDRYARITETQRDDRDVIHEDATATESDARLFFTVEPMNRKGIPTRYVPLLQKVGRGGDADLVLDPIPTAQLKALYHRVPFGQGSVTMVQMETGLFAPATYHSFYADITGNRTLYHAGFNVTRFERGEPGQLLPVASPHKISLRTVEDMVFPRASVFKEIPELPQNHKYFVQVEGESAVPVLVLAFQEHVVEDPWNGGTYAYIVRRGSLEDRDANPKVYRIPFGLLRTTYAQPAARLLVESRSQKLSLDWLHGFEYPLPDQEGQPFTRAYQELQLKLNAALLADRDRDFPKVVDGALPQHPPILIHGMPCGEVVQQGVPQPH